MPTLLRKAKKPVSITRDEARSAARRVRKARNIAFARSGVAPTVVFKLEAAKYLGHFGAQPPGKKDKGGAGKRARRRKSGARRVGKKARTPQSRRRKRAAHRKS